MKKNNYYSVNVSFIEKILMYNLVIYDLLLWISCKLKFKWQDQNEIIFFNFIKYMIVAIRY